MRALTYILYTVVGWQRGEVADPRLTHKPHRLVDGSLLRNEPASARASLPTTTTDGQPTPCRGSPLSGQGSWILGVRLCLPVRWQLA